MQKFQGFEFIEPLVTDMVQDDPTKRPKMDEVVTRFHEIKGKTQFMETTLPDSPARRNLAPCSMAIRWSLVSNHWLRLGS